MKKIVKGQKISKGIFRHATSPKKEIKNCTAKFTLTVHYFNAFPSKLWCFSI